VQRQPGLNENRVVLIPVGESDVDLADTEMGDILNERWRECGDRVTVISSTCDGFDYRSRDIWRREITARGRSVWYAFGRKGM
jgi:hypothetical protein